MASFKLDNGRTGAEYACHTATGYQCIANHPGNNKGQVERVVFYAKHVVARDGRPYTEIGLSGLFDNEKENAMNQIRDALRESDFIEVHDLSDVNPEIHAFMPYICSDFESVAVRVLAGKAGISIVVDIIGKMILDTSRSFVLEQESVPNVLFESLLASMGEELSRSPGGDDYAVKKARELANMFENGVSEIALMN